MPSRLLSSALSPSVMLEKLLCLGEEVATPTPPRALPLPNAWEEELLAARPPKLLQVSASAEAEVTVTRVVEAADNEPLSRMS